jgi:hypothetical protein
MIFSIPLTAFVLPSAFNLAINFAALLAKSAFKSSAV